MAIRLKYVRDDKHLSIGKAGCVRVMVTTNNVVGKTLIIRKRQRKKGTNAY